jgi:hypothetical protein
MTQFIVVTGNASYLESPLGISVLPVEQVLLPMLAGVGRRRSGLDDMAEVPLGWRVMFDFGASSG